MNDTEIDQMLDTAAHAAHVVPAGLVKRIADSIEPSLRPVRPLAPTWMLTLGLVLSGTAVAVFGALRAGFQGLEALSIAARIVIFGTVALLACWAAAEAVRAWIPGRQRTPSGAILGTASAALLAVFALLFRDYQTHHFLFAGLTCLGTGLLHALPAAVLGWWLLRRGYVLNAVPAGLLAGTFAGLAGIAMLELHCTNFEAAHVLVWHTLVVPVSAAAGALAGWALGKT